MKRIYDGSKLKPGDVAHYVNYHENGDVYLDVIIKFKSFYYTTIFAEVLFLKKGDWGQDTIRFYATPEYISDIGSNRLYYLGTIEDFPEYFI
jgi:hypothetical protein